jgi:hypothetical protein
LYAQIRHIEVVSVILRFTFPQEFGIISPRVVSLLNLVPVESETHPEHYLRYLRALRDLSSRYSEGDPILRGLSKVDMGLWAAAHLSTDIRYDALAEEMHRDKFFQEIRLKHLAEGFGSQWTRTDAQRLILARVVLEHDFVLAALIASRAFESVVFEICSRAGLEPDANHHNLEYLIDKIKAKRTLPYRLEVSGKDLDEWRRCRNDTVHPESERGSITSKRARDFLRGVQKLYDNLDRI